MSVLSKDKIVAAVEAGRIKIEPYRPENLGPASYDLTLGTEFRKFQPLTSTLSIDETVNYKDITEKYVLDGTPGNDRFLLKPMETCLAITEEKVSIGTDLCGLLEGRSRFARLGLFIHITAGFMNPGIQNRQVLEIFNSSPNVVELRPGTRICQFVFINMDGTAEYRGRFKDQDL